jgi:Zn-dependent protease
MMGSLMLLFTGFGWAKPVPINPGRLRQHSRAALLLVALSGPFANFLLAMIAAVPLRLGWVSLGMPQIGFFPSPYQFLIFFFFTNLGLMLFNLIPLPPLDGEEILVFFLPPTMEEAYGSIRPYGPYILLILLFLGPLLGFSLIDSVLSPAILGIGRILLGGF